MICHTEPDDPHTEFLCMLSEGLSSGQVPYNKLRQLLNACPAELQHRWLANAKIVELLDRLWPHKTATSCPSPPR